MRSKYTKIFKFKKVLSIVLTLNLLLYLIQLPVLASAAKKTEFADFNMIYKANDKSYIVNNSVLPEMIGFKLPYQIYCTNLSKGGETYQWMMKSPGKEYILIDTTPNFVIKINNYGPTYIKLKINGSDKQTKEYCVTANEYGVISKKEIVKDKEYSVNKDVYSVITTVKTTSKFVVATSDVPDESRELIVDKDYNGKPDFKISYKGNNKFYNVTNSIIPNIVSEMPYKVILTDLTKVNTDFVWYIKFPTTDYIWMDNHQNALATIWTYGTIKFKLVLNGNESNAIEYTVTSFPADKQKELEEAQKELESKEQENTNTNFVNQKKDLIPKFKINHFLKNSVFDVTNAVIPGNVTTIPYKVSLINLSSGEKTYDWSIKVPGSYEYLPVNDLTATISAYGPVSIRLRLDNDDKKIVENQVISYFSSENSDISNHRFQPVENPDEQKASFKIQSLENGIFKDVDNSLIKKEAKDIPINLYLTNLSSGNINDEWFIKFPSKDYVYLDKVPNPVVTISQSGTIYFKLCINGDKNKTAEFFVKIYSKDDEPKIISPESNIKTEKGDIKLSWNGEDSNNTYYINLFNETRKQLILNRIKVIGKKEEVLSKDLFEEGCNYSLRVISSENDFSDKITFSINGLLDLLKKPISVKTSFENPIMVKESFSTISRLSTQMTTDFFKFDIKDNSEIGIQLLTNEGKDLGIEILDANNNIQGKGKVNDEGKLEYLKVLRAGSYFLKVYSNENIGSNGENYRLTVDSNNYYPKTLLLYTGYGYKNDTFARFPDYTDNDLEKLVGKSDNNSQINDFLILCGNMGCYGLHEAIPKEKEDEILNSIKVENNSDLEFKETVKKEIESNLKEYLDLNGDGVLEKNPNFIPYSRTLDSFAEECVTLAVRLLKKSPKTKLWFSLPDPVNSTLADYYTNVYNDKFIKGIKNKLNAQNPDYWRDNVVGFYYSHEEIPEAYTSFETKDNRFLLDNPLVKSMNQLSEIIHNDENKLFMWIPCMQPASSDVKINTIKRIGYIANATNIFDYVIIQPNRMFDGTDYVSKGTGSDEINIVNDDPKSGQELNIKINCKTNKNMRVTVLDFNGNQLLKKEGLDNGNMEIVFTPDKGLYTIIATVLDSSSTKIFAKSIFVETPTHCEYNIPTVVNSIKNNCVYYEGENDTESKKVVEKISSTNIGFEMEIDPYYVDNPENIDFNKHSTYQLNAISENEKWNEEIKSTAIKDRNEELNKYYKYLSIQKNNRYKEYTKAFNYYKRTKPFAFYTGSRNELLFGITDGIIDATDKIINTVTEFMTK